MPLGKRILSAAVALTFLGWASSAGAQGEEAVVIEIFVDQTTGDTEIVCPTTACNAVCRDIEGTQILLAGNYYRIGSNCSLEITDGTVLQEAIETVLALIGDEVPGGPGPGPGPTPTGFPNPESNPNQNNPGLASPTEAGPVVQ